jgi:hypothetical protein
MSDQSLAERERQFCASLGYSERAKRIAPKLGEVSEELQTKAARVSGAEKELLELAAEQIDQARDLLRILEQEQWRQREAINLYLYGKVDRDFLKNISSSWNESRP